MSKKKKKPPKLLSTYDPLFKKELSKMDEFQKIPRPQARQHETKRGMCWCGDPSCPGGGVASGSLSYTSDGSGGLTPVQGESATERYDRQRQEQKKEVYRRMYSWMAPPSVSTISEMLSRSNEILGQISANSPAQPQEPELPVELRKARKAVKQYLLETKHETKWDDIIGNDEARRSLIEAIEEPKLSAELYGHYGMKPPKGCLLFGPPGCGKTMFAKAASAAIARVYGTRAEVLVISGPSIQSKFIGETEETIRAIFLYAREYRKFFGHPLVVFFDEADALFPDRTGRTRRVAPWEESQVAQFLSEMDGMEDCGAFVILATNRPESLDEALLRDGRCDRKIEVKRPTKEAAEVIIRKSLADVPLGDELDSLVMAGVESMFDPHYVIAEGQILLAKLNLKTEEILQSKQEAVNFCLEHIVSGAMLVSLAARAKSRAFRRDKASGQRSGLSIDDMIQAVREVFEENKKLEHGLAMKEFIANLGLEDRMKEMLEPKGRLN